MLYAYQLKLDEKLLSKLPSGSKTGDFRFYVDSGEEIQAQWEANVLGGVLDVFSRGNFDPIRFGLLGENIDKPTHIYLIHRHEDTELALAVSYWLHDAMRINVVLSSSLEALNVIPVKFPDVADDGARPVQSAEFMRGIIVQQMKEMVHSNLMYSSVCVMFLNPDECNVENSESAQSLCSRMLIMSALSNLPNYQIEPSEGHTIVTMSFPRMKVGFDEGTQLNVLTSNILKNWWEKIQQEEDHSTMHALDYLCLYRTKDK